MSFSQNQAVNEMWTLLRTAWSAAGLTLANILYEDIPGKPPNGNVVWARAMVRHVEGGQASLGGRSVKRWNRSGVLTIQVFAPVGKGLSVARQNAKMVCDAYEGKQTPGAVWFRNVRLNEIGADGDFAQVNAIAEFTYDEVR